ncbi:Hsp20/alpha crystallin family protein [Patescibacteria group bacterium]
MPKNTGSFFERLTGNITVDDENNTEDVGIEEILENPAILKNKEDKVQDSWVEEDGDGQLTVDMYQKPNEIVIQAMLAGVKPEDLDVSITQDMITLKGNRRKVSEVTEDNYFYRELYWGGFSRSILLPQEINPEKADASMKNGLLVIKLPKIIKEKTQKLNIKIE